MDYEFFRRRNPFINQVNSDKNLKGEHHEHQNRSRNPFINQVNSDPDDNTDLNATTTYHVAIPS